jgi:hypothetical protein
MQNGISTTVLLKKASTFYFRITFFALPLKSSSYTDPVMLDNNKKMPYVRFGNLEALLLSWSTNQIVRY